MILGVVLPWTLVCLLLLAGTAAAGGPSIQETRALLQAAAARESDTRALGRTMGLVHGALVVGAPPGTLGPLCEVVQRRDLALRSGALGAAHREAAQSVRAAVRRAREAADSSTTAPLLSVIERAELERLEAFAGSAALEHATLAAWHQRFVAPALAACSTATWEFASPGLTVPGVGAEAVSPVPVILTGPGFLCPGAVQGAVVLVEGGLACYAPDDACGCEPVAVLPGAVLSLTPPPPPPQPPAPAPPGDAAAPVAAATPAAEGTDGADATATPAVEVPLVDLEAPNAPTPEPAPPSEAPTAEPAPAATSPAAPPTAPAASPPPSAAPPPATPPADDPAPD